MRRVDLAEASVAVRYRTLLTLWIGMMMSIVIWFVLTRWLEVRNPENPQLGLLLICFGFVPMSSSFLVKQVLVGKAIDRQDPRLLQPAYVVALALCEIAALLGLLARFAASSPHYYAAFVIAGSGMLLHFPQRRHVLAALGQEF